MIGTTVLYFEILEKLGEGGMGVVYKARDTRLDRIVALKFLPERASASDPDGSRFLQEARAAAALNHPNICTIHGIEEADGRGFIVMEFVDGQTLQEKKHALSLKQAIDIGIQVAEGLAAAHERGIVHRDIKPENIMIRKDGIAQIMDFGLAKLRGASRLTKEGSTLGTIGYMSPEQVQGLEADHRSDLFSLGVILYELFAGRSPFNGVHDVAIAYEIVHVEAPPISSINPGISPELEDLVLACLVKDPHDRSQSAAELARNLRRLKRDSEPARGPRTSVAPGTSIPAPAGHLPSAVPSSKDRFFPLPRKAAHWAVLLSSCALVALAAWLAGRQSPPEPPVEVRKFQWPTDAYNVMLSPDGKKIASSRGRTISIRTFASLHPVTVEAPEGVARIYWAPNSEQIAYFTFTSELRRVSASGTEDSRIAMLKSDSFPRYWGRDDSIMISRWDNAGASLLMKVASSGGSPVPAFRGDSARAKIRGDLTQVAELPDGSSLLISINAAESCTLYVQSGSGRRAIHSGAALSGLAGPFYSTGGHILAAHRSPGIQGRYDLWAIPFDLSRLERSGDPFLVAQNADNFSVSDNGMIAYVDRSGLKEGEELAVLSRAGKLLEVVGLPDLEVTTPSLSPDGSLVAASNRSRETGRTDVWLHDLGRRTRTQFSFDIPVAWNPVWSPDGREIVFASGSIDSLALHVQPTDGISAARRLLPSGYFGCYPRFSPDGKRIYFMRWLPDVRQGDIWYLDRARADAPQPVFESRFVETYPCPSPDGRYLAYQSDRTGQTEIYVTKVPEADRHEQISFSGGQYPEWVGNEIFFVGPRSNELMAAEVFTKPVFRSEVPRRLFHADSAGVQIQGWFRSKFTVSHDGQRILASRNATADTKPSLVIVENWFEEFRRRGEPRQDP